MARGNDAEAAREEMMAKYPAATQQGATQDLDEMVRKSNEQRDPELVRASGHRLDEKATEELDMESLEVPEGFEKIVAAAVRDGVIIAVAERSMDDESVPEALRGTREKVVIGEAEGGQAASRKRAAEADKRENARAQSKEPEEK